MSLSSTYKLVQKRLYDVLSHRYGTICVICGVLLVIASAFQFGESAMEWSTEKYAAVFNSFSDNIAGRSFRQRLCLPVPIDVVYTWVNGTDPELLQQLHAYKKHMEHTVNATNTTNDSSLRNVTTACPFANCVSSLLGVVDARVSVPLPSLALLYPRLSHAHTVFHAVTLADQANITVFEFSDSQAAEEASMQKLFIEGKNLTLDRGYYTTDLTILHSIELTDTVLMTGFPHTLEDEEKLKGTIPSKYHKSITQFKLHAQKGVAVIRMSDKDDMHALIKDSNITIESKTPTFSPAALVWDLNDDRLSEDVAASRFMDNEELRYSLRSISQFAPWVRHVYIVTNGQIPSWLNLDSPRLTIVTHQELFPNASHLPTFSSPAIESHLHRIPGLSDKFLYLNDDVMFGRPVWPDDFFTHSGGQKIYLTWPVPNCQEGCPSTWIRDGYCDKACNNSECEWDGGDCTGANNNRNNFDFGGGGDGGGGAGWMQDDSTYCNGGCANNWLADRYCDNACNVPQCAYDAGDCGTHNYHHLHQLLLSNSSMQAAHVPRGETMFYFNVSVLVGSGGKVEEGEYDDAAMVRTVAIAQKFGVVTVLLYPQPANATTLAFRLTGKNANNTKVTVNVTVAVDTRPVETANEEIPVNETKEVFVFEEVPMDLVGPHVDVQAGPSEIQEGELRELHHYILPHNIQLKYHHLIAAHTEGELTGRGYKREISALWEKLLLQLKQEGKELEKAPPKEHHNEEKANEGKDEEGVKFQQVEGEEKQEHEHHVEERDLQQEQEHQMEERDQKQQQEQALLFDNKGDHRNPNDNQQRLDQEAHEQQEQLHQEIKQQMNQEPQQQMHQKDQQQQEQELIEAQKQHDLRQEIKQQMNEEFKKQMNQVEQHQQENEAVQEQVNQEPLQEQVNQEPLQEQVNQEPLQQKNEAEHQQENERAEEDPKEVVQEQKQQRPQAAMKVTQPSTPRRKDDQRLPGNGTKDKDEYELKDAIKSRKLNAVDDVSSEDNGDREFLKIVQNHTNNAGFLPWEKQGLFKGVSKVGASAYETRAMPQRRLLDTFGDSLRHVNRLYNAAFGVAARKVPGHMPHMIDRHVMAELQDRFAAEWDVTSSHKVRSPNDMQYAFSYFYYLMGLQDTFSAATVFQQMDTDKSGVLSDREIRTLATRLYDLPLDLHTLTALESKFSNCSTHITPQLWRPGFALAEETYYDKNMPQITEYLFVNCPEIVELVKQKFPTTTKYKYEIASEEEIAFKMIRTNISTVVGQLDDIRKNPKKFVCLNDNIDHSKPDAKTVQAILQDFYESLLPIQSEFELPREYRNRFTHMDELREWRKYRDWLKLWTEVALTILVLFTLASFFQDRLDALQRYVFGRGRASSPRPPLQAV